MLMQIGGCASNVQMQIQIQIQIQTQTLIQMENYEEAVYPAYIPTGTVQAAREDPHTLSSLPKVSFESLLKAEKMALNIYK